MKTFALLAVLLVFCTTPAPIDGKCGGGGGGAGLFSRMSERRADRHARQADRAAMRAERSAGRVDSRRGMYGMYMLPSYMLPPVEVLPVVPMQVPPMKVPAAPIQPPMPMQSYQAPMQSAGACTSGSCSTSMRGRRR